MLRIRRHLARLDRFAARLEDGLLVLLLGGMLLLAVLQILLRNVWDTGLVWSDPLLRLTVLWLGLLGAVAATREHKHIRIDLLARLLPPPFARAAILTAGLFTTAICAVIAWHGARFVALEAESELVVFAGVPAWVAGAIIPVGFAVMALRFFASAVLCFSTKEAPR